MISRYTRPEMGKIWELENRFQKMLDVEIAVAMVQGDLGIVPKKDAMEIKKKAKFSVSKIAKIEEKTKHDVIAFVTNVAENVGPSGRFVHFGLTSSDVLDSALSLQIKEASELIFKGIDKLENSLINQIEAHKETLCAGRTHGIHAEPLTFGLKLSGFLAELRRNRRRFETAVKQSLIVKLSGAVGTYSSLSPKVEELVGKKLGLSPELIATQVIPRDRHAELFMSLALLGCGLERLSIELRHLQRTEVGEILEGFTKGQKGSSAMPHKRNPISGENLTGLARLLKSYAQAGLDNVALWHERDISHSSVERVAFPDSFILTDYALNRMAGVIDRLEVQPDRMIENMQISRGHLFSSHLLLALVEKGLSREDAYEIVQSNALNLKPEEKLSEKVLKDVRVSKLLSAKNVESIFSGKQHVKGIKKLVNRALKSPRSLM